MEHDDFFKSIKRHPDRFYIIHYSSQALYDDGLDGLSPRITSIVVMHFSTRQTVSFALHAVAETLGIAKEDVEKNYDRIEGALLERFYSFVRDRREKYWVHWQMRNLTFGFEHLEHRYRSLTGKDAPVIPIEVRLNLSDILGRRYGNDFAPNPRMKSLMRLNGDLDQRFLDGAAEADAFKKMEFIRMNSSTISKVEFFHHVISEALAGTLRTAGNGVGVFLDRTFESRTAKAIALISGAVGIVLAIAEGAKLIAGS